MKITTLIKLCAFACIALINTNTQAKMVEYYEDA